MLLYTKEADRCCTNCQLHVCFTHAKASSDRHKLLWQHTGSARCLYSTRASVVLCSERNFSFPSVCRLTDDGDRSWLIAALRDTIKAHFSLKLDDLVRHLAPSSHTEVGPEELRGLLFGGYLDATADSPAERMYAEARVRVPCPSFAYVCFCIVFRWA